IAHRKAIDVTRRTAKHAIPVGTMPHQDGAPAADRQTPTVDADLATAVATLPPKQKQCVVYHYLADLSYDEVAKIVGGSTDAARRAAADGIARLRRSWTVTVGNHSAVTPDTTIGPRGAA